MSNTKRLEDFTKEELHAALVEAVNDIRFTRVALAKMTWSSARLSLPLPEYEPQSFLWEWYQAKCAENPEWRDHLLRADHDPKLS